MSKAATHTVHLHLSGEYDLARRSELAAVLKPAKDADLAVIDMEAVTYMDSTALGCLIRLKKEMMLGGKSGNIHIVNLHPSLSRIFHICNLDKMFMVFERQAVPQSASPAVAYGSERKVS
ncbi:MAG: STAS domain-containing protein [Candidatus Baltobacteraceae bacterium]